MTTGPVTGPGTLNHGGGVTSVQRFNLPTVNLSAGTLAVAAGGGTANTSRAENLAISGASRLDLTDHDFILDYSGASPAETVRGHLRTGYNNGAWNGSVDPLFREFAY